MHVTIVGFQPQTSSLSFLLKKEGTLSINGNPYLGVVTYTGRDQSFREPEWNDFLPEKSFFSKEDFFALATPVSHENTETANEYTENIWNKYSHHPEVQSFKQKILVEGKFTTEEYGMMVTRMVEIVQELFRQNKTIENGSKKERI